MKVPIEVTLKSKGPFSDGRNHPNPSFEKEGLIKHFFCGKDYRHPELVSGPQAVKPEGCGRSDGFLKQVQDDESTTHHVSPM